VPETVHHVVVPVDPQTDPSWMGLRNCIQTDGVHQRDNVGHKARDSPEKWSEAVKTLKGKFILIAIERFLCLTEQLCVLVGKNLVTMNRFFFALTVAVQLT